MPSTPERVNTPIATQELERRWKAVRAAMAQQNIDVLLMQSNNDFMGGYVKYFTDIPAVTGYPVTVVFPRDDLMTIIQHGDFGMDHTLPPEGDGVWRGVKKHVGEPYFSSVNYTWAYDARLAETALASYVRATVGLVGLATLPVSMLDHLRHGRLAGAKFVAYATELVDAIKCIKSEAELAFIRNTAALQDKAIQAALKAVRPGMREVEIAAVAEHEILAGGGEQALLLTCSYAPGEAVTWNGRHFQNKVIRPGDMLSLLVETNGPGGFYTEISRTCVVGKLTQAMQDELGLLKEARKLTLDRLVPGASCKDIWDAYNVFLDRHGIGEEKRLYTHGQGYDLVERPLVRRDEPMLIQANMNITVHPVWVHNGLLTWLCDNYLIGESGVTGRIHTTPEQIFEAG